MDASNQLTTRGRLYVYGVIAIGAAVLAVAVIDLPKGPDGYYLDWLILAALTAISGSATIKLPSVPASLSVSETFVFTSVILFGPAAGTLTVALDGLIISLWLSRHRKEPHRVLFNMAAPAISIWIASQIFFIMAGMQPLAYGGQAVHVNAFILPLLVFTALFFGINSWMIAFAVALETGESPAKIWRTNFMWLSLNFFCGASVAALLAVSVDPTHVDLTYLGAVVPLLLGLYLTYRTAMGRVQDAMGHLQRMNKLHLATIETLAHAVDAKDQVTHGHIRRVQNLTTQVATALGVSDELQLRAIEASALLHDMGKLAIPEHILNKPGKLTPAEFDKMKLHASIGAEILSSIEFPYPVVPIVRHHHENWDGSGYPDGISGVEIPIGARILSVVDCYDALTSDRPYRPALTPSEAMRIVMDRRGSMYDPLVVDTFARVQSSLTERSNGGSPATYELVTTPDSQVVASPVMPENRGVSDSLAVLRLLELFSDLSEQPWEDVADLVAHRLSLAVPFTHAAMYLYDHGRDELVASWVSPGVLATRIRGLKIKRGEGVSGWVAANRRSITNSPASLDLLAASVTDVRLSGMTLSVPLTLGERLVGVLTLYRETEGNFTATDLEVIESGNDPIALMVSRSQPFAAATARHGGHTYPNAHHLDAFLRQSSSRGSKNTSEKHLLVFQLSHDHGSLDFVNELAARASNHLRGGDVVFVCDSRTIVCLLTASSETNDVAVSKRISVHLKGTPLLTGQEVRSTIVVAPRDGANLASLLDLADRRLHRAVA